MRIDHIGYAVKSIEKSKASFELLGFRFKDTIIDEVRHISIAFGENDGYVIELVAPLSLGSPVDTLLTKNGSAPYHICYKSDDIESDINRLLNNKYKITVPLAPAIAFDNRRVVFMYSLSVGLIEIVEE